MGQGQTTFEEAFAKLEKTVGTLEAGGLTLEEALALYEEGMRLAKLCTDQLDAAELRITQLEAAFKEGAAANRQDDEPC